MAQFDQRGQRVNTQYNAGRDIRFGLVQSATDFIAELERLKEEVATVSEMEFSSAIG